MKFPDDDLTVIVLANPHPVPLEALQDDLPAMLFGEHRAQHRSSPFS